MNNENIVNRITRLANDGLDSEEIAQELYCTNNIIKKIARKNDIDVEIVEEENE